MQSVLVWALTTWRQTAAWVRTSTSKPWYPLKKLDLRSIRLRSYPIHPSQSQLHTIYRCDIQLGAMDPESWNHQLLQDFSQERAVENYDPSLIAKYAINLACLQQILCAHSYLDESLRTRKPSCFITQQQYLKEALRLLMSMHLRNVLLIYDGYVEFLWEERETKCDS